MRPRTFSILLTALLFVCAGSARAQFNLGAHAGYDVDFEELFIGANAMVPIGLEIAEQLIRLNLDGSYYLAGEGLTVLAFDGNLIYPFQVEGSSIKPYAGAGLVIFYTSVDTPDIGDFDFDDFFSKSAAVANVTSTDIGLSLKGGSEFGSGGAITPFAEAFLYLKDGSTFGVMGGVRFALGE